MVQLVFFEVVFQWVTAACRRTCRSCMILEEHMLSILVRRRLINSCKRLNKSWVAKTFPNSCKEEANNKFAYHTRMKYLEISV